MIVSEIENKTAQGFLGRSLRLCGRMETRRDLMVRKLNRGLPKKIQAKTD